MLMAPTKGTITKEVVLEDIEGSVVKDLLHFLYGGTFEDTMLKENTRLIALLSATKRFGMSLLEKLCAEALKDLLPSHVDAALEYFNQQRAAETWQQKLRALENFNWGAASSPILPHQNIRLPFWLKAICLISH